LIPWQLCRLPKGELRSKANKTAASKKKRQQLSKEATRIRVGIVYFIQDVVALSIKIGFCLKNPEKRLAALQTGNSNTLRLLGHIPGSDSHEKLLHTRFARFHIQGEWFSNAIAEEMEDILKHQSMEQWLQLQTPAPILQELPVDEANLVNLP
jgi:hypothetical protein